MGVRRVPVKNASERYKRLAQEGYLRLTREGYVITPAGLKALEEETK